MKKTTKEIIMADASAESLEKAAKEIVNLLGYSNVVTFTGELGAGKTTLISAICRILGVDGEETSSPSFALVNEYRSETSAELIYHFDLYRLKNLAEALDLGLEDYLDCGALCLIEWPQVAEDVLPEDAVNVEITVNDDKSRRVTVSYLPEE